jgi:hypothetical protein
MVAVGHILVLLGFVAMLIGDVMFLTVAYKRSLWWFFGCLFIPLVDLVFLFMNWRATARPFGLSVLGLIVACIGGSLAGITLE